MSTVRAPWISISCGLGNIKLYSGIEFSHLSCCHPRCCLGIKPMHVGGQLRKVRFGLWAQENDVFFLVGVWWFGEITTQKYENTSFLARTPVVLFGSVDTCLTCGCTRTAKAQVIKPAFFSPQLSLLFLFIYRSDTLLRIWIRCFCYCRIGYTVAICHGGGSLQQRVRVDLLDGSTHC